MSQFTGDWAPLLDTLNAASLRRESSREAGLPPEVVESGWCGYHPATEAELRDVEERLGMALPPSYRSFLQITNGWWSFDSFIYDLLPASEVDWFRLAHPTLLPTESEMARTVPDEIYFDYEQYGEDPIMYRPEYLADCLTLSSFGDSAFLLLNPKVVTPAGEWEAWFLAYWGPGAVRYRSFWELVEHCVESDEQLSRERANRERR